MVYTSNNNTFLLFTIKKLNMNYNTEWKTNWLLKTFTFEELFKIVKEGIVKQFDTLSLENVLLTNNFYNDYEADSVDIIALLMLFQDKFKNEFNTNVEISINHASNMQTVEDLLTIIYEVLLENNK